VPPSRRSHPGLPLQVAQRAGRGRVWSDDTRLDAELTVPWGTAPGRGAISGYLDETLVHGWGLAVATGQEPEADPVLAGAVLAIAQRMIPAEPRGGERRFAPAVEPRAGAGHGAAGELVRPRPLSAGRPRVRTDPGPFAACFRPAPDPRRDPGGPDTHSTGASAQAAA
jgi:hypothetical protein